MFDLHGKQKIDYREGEAIWEELLYSQPKERILSLMPLFAGAFYKLVIVLVASASLFHFVICSVEN